jgi:hypothetical protein
MERRQDLRTESTDVALETVCAGAAWLTAGECRIMLCFVRRAARRWVWASVEGEGIPSSATTGAKQP